MTPAEDYEVRERKQSMFQLSDDPFAQATGTGHRGSIAGIGGAHVIEAQKRRKSSAIGPDVHAAAQHHSGYDGDKLAPIQSRIDGDGVTDHDITGNGTAGYGTTSNGPTTTTTTTTSTTTTSNAGHANFYNQATHDDPDSVAPHDTR